MSRTVRVTMKHPAMRRLLTSTSVRSDLAARAERVRADFLDKATPNAETDVVSMAGRRRAGALVWVGHPNAARRREQVGLLLSALDAAR